MRRLANRAHTSHFKDGGRKPARCAGDVHRKEEFPWHRKTTFAASACYPPQPIGGKNKTKMQSRATEQYSVKTHKGSYSHNLSNVYVAFKSTSRMNKDFFTWIFISYIIFFPKFSKISFQPYWGKRVRTLFRTSMKN